MTANRRLLRTEALLGKAGIEKLQNSTVMIVGLGAVGGYALEALARSGIGHLILVDFDVIEETNVNRQILAVGSTIGMLKTEASRERVREINPDCRVEILNLFVNSGTIPELLSHRADIVIDAIDALNPKCCLMEELYRRDIPFISSMGAALKTDPAKIHYGKLSDTKNCSLSRFIRKRLKKRGIDISRIACVFSDEQNCLNEGAIFQDEETVNTEISAGRQGRVRNTLGSMPTITAIFGLTIANQVILQLTKP